MTNTGTLSPAVTSHGIELHRILNDPFMSVADTVDELYMFIDDAADSDEYLTGPGMDGPVLDTLILLAGAYIAGFERIHPYLRG